MVKISESQYEAREHFVIATLTAEYWLDRNSGGLSRMIDRDGHDWIAFKKEPWGQYPASAASSFRGLPNLVFGGDDNGFGHPGWDLGSSRQVGKNTIISTSTSGKWELTWDFGPREVHLCISKADPERNYWFLYEGLVAGTWAPQSDYFATDVTKPELTPHDYFKEDPYYGNWQWAYFGNQSVERVLYIVHEQKDQLSDLFAHLGNTEKGLDSPDGMLVFGFGRGEDAKPLLSGQNSFRIGFLEKSGNTDYATLKNSITK